ncbi:hypothetical protein LIER_27860 [Lithospermum erythrorhizon]|uniref:Uncharacterized protein n=1 Tax=Lithospermum erythrorhizon TaxID=34254 RepID=A0AAV3RDV0_LITER
MGKDKSSLTESQMVAGTSNPTSSSLACTTQKKVTPHVRTPDQFTQPLEGLGAFQGCLHDLRLALAFRQLIKQAVLSSYSLEAKSTGDTLLLKGGVLTFQFLKTLQDTLHKSLLFLKGL